MPEIVIDPEVPEGARRELEQASLSALAGFGDPVPGQEPPGQESPAGPGDESAARPPGVRVVVGIVVAAKTDRSRFAPGSQPKSF